MGTITKFQTPELRHTQKPVTFRSVEGGDNIVEGTAIVYGQETIICDYFREIVEPGACTDAIKNCDVRCLFNHNANQILARSNKGQGTLELVEDETGVHFKYTTPDRQFARDVYDAIRTGDVSGCSFSWDDEESEWIEMQGENESLPLHRIKKINNLLDVGPVTYPAYEMTSTSARDKFSVPVNDHRDADIMEMTLARYKHAF